MGVGNTGPVSEFNIQIDPEAAKIVFDSGLPVTMVIHLVSDAYYFHFSKSIFNVLHLFPNIQTLPGAFGGDSYRPCNRRDHLEIPRPRYALFENSPCFC